MRKLLLCFLALPALAADPQFLTVSNPPPKVSLAWTPSPDAGVTNYNVYFGVQSGQYTNVTAFGNVTNCTLTLPGRGPTYYFAATAVSGGLESGFSNEAAYTPATPPKSPGLGTIITLAVQSKDCMDQEWGDAGMDWSISPMQAQQVFRLTLTAR